SGFWTWPIPWVTEFAGFRAPGRHGYRFGLVEQHARPRRRPRGSSAVLDLATVVVANTARVTLVLFVAAWWGQDAAIGFFHGLSSLLLFGVALGGLLVVSRTVG